MWGLRCCILSCGTRAAGWPASGQWWKLGSTSLGAALGAALHLSSFVYPFRESSPRKPSVPLTHAGTTSQALIKEQPWLQKHLSTVASGIAIVVGALMLAAGLGVEVPFFS